MHIRAQIVRAHAEEHPVDFIGQFADYIGDHRQVTVVTGAATPADPRFFRGAALTAQIGPQVRRQHVGHHTNVVMHVRQRIAQRLGGDHHAIAHADGTPYQLLHFVLARHVADMRIAVRNVDHEIIELIDAPRAGVFLQARDFVDRTFGIAPLQDDHVRRMALDFDDGRQVVMNAPMRPAGGLQFDQRLRDPIMANGGCVDRQRENLRQLRLGKRTPTGSQAGLETEACPAQPLQRQVGVVGRITGHDRQPALIENFLLLFAAGLITFPRSHGRLCAQRQLRVRRPDHQVTFLADAQAQVHFVEGLRQALLIEATDGIKDRLAHHQAIATDGTVVVGDLQAVHVARRVQRLAMERHAGRPLQPED
ncbi:hypothetical protein D3C81_805340 [compost metagenome]